MSFEVVHKREIGVYFFTDDMSPDLKTGMIRCSCHSEGKWC